ncbi:hypothetical protein D9611_004979 [Ephemerocybe angulata]|uniref:CxC1-like cysteine cluster associated with KDZ transposases domain-containing protein n=1 Tax=Ephemerocybe angulata TaxID=980116 RepID=A0A8H5EX85_9AGAR|nr:hypothetical protein D9611_004979 [Tulosesus angulatus]
MMNGGEPDDNDWEDEQITPAGVLDGSTRLESSHAGGEFRDLVGEKKRRRQIEYRTSRREQTHRRNDGFEKQMQQMVWAFMRWDELVGSRGFRSGGVPEHAFQEREVQGTYKITVVDCFEIYTHLAELREGDQGVPAALLSQGLVPTAPYSPSTAFTVRNLELYRSLHLRSPSLALQPYVKGLCDLQGLPFRRSYSDAFNNAYDLYLRLLEEVENAVLRTLGRGERIWRMKNACPACTYVLDGEAVLRFRMLVTMDGGNSLKRLARREMGKESGDVLGPMRGVRDDRTVSQRYYLTREEVNKWAKPTAPPAGPSTASPENDAFDETEGEASSPCASRWHNMNSEATAKMWGIFDETGIFLCLCRHGFVLSVSDMVQSGEQSKYPLATVENLINTFGSRIGCGYDIGCKFSSTIANSALSAKARGHEFTSLVGAFHGHAHNRLCQLSNLAAYVPGMGIEDLEGCERMFSKSNQLAPSLRYASPFHRTQKIDQFFHHMDSYETMANLSKFLVDNYKQALEILSEQDELARMMKDQGIANIDVFSTWLDEEQEPPKETLEMDYYQKLVEYKESEANLAKARSTFLQHDPSAPPPPSTGKRTQSPETKMRHATELNTKILRAVMDLELKLDVKKRWTEGSKDWVAAADLVSKRRYQRCLDQLESLIVSRMFELTKMNMSKTGYKLRTHISKSLQTRSQAIRNALERYNVAAAAMKPPQQSLSWDQVVEYAFLADFDLLRVSREDIRARPWAQPINRAIMHKYFKIQRAREEIQRLDIEIRRVVTYIQDEQAFLRDAESAPPSLPNDISVLTLTPDDPNSRSPSDPPLTYHIRRYADRRTLFFEGHLARFKKLKDTVPQLATALMPGVPVDKSLRRTSKAVKAPTETGNGCERQFNAFEKGDGLPGSTENTASDNEEEEEQVEEEEEEEESLHRVEEAFALQE